MFSRESTYSFIFALFLGVALAVGASVWATSIGNDVTVTNALSVTGTSALTGAVTTTGAATVGTDLTVTSGARVGTGSTGTHLTALADDTLFVEGQAEFDGIVWFDASLQASSTALITGAATFYGNVTVGDGTGDTLTITGTSITHSNAGTTTIPATDANSWSFATSSANIPMVKINTSTSRIGIGTTTPGASLAVGNEGTALVMGSGTSTLSLQSTGGTNKGGCLEVEDTAGTGAVFSLMATGAGIAYWTTGGCR